MDLSTEMHVVTCDNEPICRICHGGANAFSDQLHACCNCRGSIQLVHRPCLAQWLSTTPERACELCGHHYDLVHTATDFWKWLLQDKRHRTMYYFLLQEIAFTEVMGVIFYHIVHRCTPEKCFFHTPTLIVIFFIVLLFIWWWGFFLLRSWYLDARGWWRNIKYQLLVLDIE